MKTQQLAPRYKVTKLESARRQLRVAISLWFQNGDEIAIHTLACAAHQIIHDINQKKGGRDLLYDSIIFRPEYQSDAVKWLKKDMNFFKHADKDPEGVTEFCPSLSELFIIMSLFGIEIFGLKHDPIESAFISWHMIRHPEHLTDKGLSERARFAELGGLTELERGSPALFFRNYLQVSNQFHHIR